MRIIILPGLDGTGKMLVEFVSALAEYADVSVIDYPKDQKLSYKELSEIVVDQLLTDQPFGILAESFSGPIAAIIAAKQPAGLESVIFAASFVHKPTFLPRTSAIVVRSVRTKSPTLLKILQPLTFGRWASKELHELLIRSVREVSTSVLADRIRAVLTINVLSDFKKSEVPMLYLRPSHDRLVSRKAGQEMKSAMPHMELREIDGPHFILQVKPKECAAIIGRFLDLEVS